jgi:hypothetical protein
MALGYVERSKFDEFYMLIRHAERALNGYMNYVRKQRAGEDMARVREETEQHYVDEGGRL